jgi:hypothetical protein
MNIVLKIFFISLTLTLSQSILAARELPEFSANYAVKKYGAKLAEAHYKLTHTESGYKFTQNTKLHGLAKLLGNDTVSAVSYIHQIDGALLLQKHTYIQTGKEKDKNEDINISWKAEDPARKKSETKSSIYETSKSKSIKGKISGTVRKNTISLETKTPVWEALSFQIPLMIEASKDIKEYPYNAIIKGKIDTYNFILTETKKVYFAKKEYQALHVVRTDPNRDRQLSIWLAPELHNLPLIIENYRNGKEHSKIQLEKVTFKNETPLIGEASFEPLIEDDDDF